MLHLSFIFYIWKIEIYFKFILYIKGEKEEEEEEEEKEEEEAIGRLNTDFQGGENFANPIYYLLLISLFFGCQNNPTQNPNQNISKLRVKISNAKISKPKISKAKAKNLNPKNPNPKNRNLNLSVSNKKISNRKNLNLEVSFAKPQKKKISSRKNINRNLRKDLKNV